MIGSSINELDSYGVGILLFSGLISIMIAFITTLFGVEQLTAIKFIPLYLLISMATLGWFRPFQDCYYDYMR